MKTAFIGGAHMDHMGKLAAEVVMGASNPGHLTSMPGGAGLNSARVARMLGSHVSIIGPIGDDLQANVIRQMIGQYNIEDQLVTVSGGRTGSYTSIIGIDGQVIVAMADLELNENMDVAWLKTHCQAALDAADLWFLTANLSRSTLAELVKEANVPLVATTVSVRKAIRLRGVLDHLDILFTNRVEAQSLLRVEDDNCAMLAEKLMARGAKSGVVSNGPGRLAFWHGGKVETRDAPQVDEIVDVTGAGDALAGTVLASLERGDDFATAVDYGIRAGGETIKVATPVREGLTWEVIS